MLNPQPRYFQQRSPFFKRNIFFICLFLCTFSLNAYALSDVYAFSNLREQQRFTRLLHDLRCVVCQNQSLYESNAPIAEDLRKEVADLVRAHQDDAHVLSYLTARYGPFILYDPPWTWQTWFLWIGPFALLFLISAILLGLNYRRWRKKHRTT